MTKKTEEKAGSRNDENGTGGDEILGILSTKQEVAEELNMSLHTFSQLERRYPFHHSGAPGKILGRWRVSKADVHRWFQFVQAQELRHPDSRRMRPEEPPALQEIKGR